MATTEEDCQAMIDACRASGVKLMVAYRLHFERANLEAIEVARSGRLGDVRLISSVFTQDVEEGNIRLKRGEGGPLFDIGIYCVNAARSIFRSEPNEVSAANVTRPDDPRFVDCPEMTSARLRFAGERLATFTCGFGASSVGYYEIVGTKGSLCVDPAYSIAEDITHDLTIKDKTRTRTFSARDQFAPELLEFSACVLEDREPEPSGEEGLADVRVLEAIESSADQDGAPVELGRFDRRQRPSLAQEARRPLPEKPELVHVDDPTP
jgi:glucose-fructose oxidoreductase